MNLSHITNQIIQSLQNIESKPNELVSITEDGQALCPFNHDPGLSTVRFDKENKTFHCVSPQCRFHGNLIDYVMARHGLPFWNAIDFLGNTEGIEFKLDFGASEGAAYERVRNSLQVAAQVYARNLNSVMPYLENRGISRATAERYLIGTTLPEKDFLKRRLTAHGFSEAVLFEAGLLNQYGDDFFRNRVMIPTRLRGQVISFYGRALDDADTVKHLRMTNDRVTLGEAPFNWNRSQEQIMVVEGVFDALALIDKGFNNAIATFGTQGLTSPKDLERFQNSSIHRVFLCRDGDEAGVKDTARSAYTLADYGLDVRIVDLGTQDPNEFMLSHKSEEFQERLDQALPPIQWDIERVNDEWPLEARIAALETVLRRCREMKPLEREATIRRIAGKLRIAKKVVEDHVTALPCADEDNLELLDLSSCRKIHPALDVMDETLLMTVPQAVANHGTGAVEWVPYVVTADREFFPVDPVELRKRGLFTNVEQMVDEPRYTSEVVKGFASGQRKGDLLKTFRRIHTLLMRNVDFPDENTYTFLTCWIIGTYFHPMFNYYPYLHFTGTKNVGKSKTMKLMSCICFNGIMSVSISPASQFRIIEAFRPTLFMDETEDLKDKGFSEKRALLLGGYEAGSSVLRTEKEKDGFKVRRMSNYGPRAFASIEGLEDTLASRTVQITMQRSFRDVIKEREINLNNPEFQEIRDELFLVAMTDAAAIKRIYEQVARPANAEFGDREFNLFKPILAVGLASGINDIKARLTEFQNACYRNKIAEYNVSAPENVLLRYLLERIVQDEWCRSDHLHAAFIEYLNTNGLDLGLRVTKSFMGTLMKKLGIVTGTRRSPDRTCTLYHLSADILKRVAENYQVT